MLLSSTAYSDASACLKKFDYRWNALLIKKREERCMPDGDKTPKVDGSVRVTELYLKGEPRGSVPMNVTIGKPQAYSPAKPGPK
mgnify:CR=1 FL=1